MNLSASGISFRVVPTPPEGADISLALELPGRTKRVELVGRVVRVVKDTGVGVAFTTNRRADRKLLAEFVEKIAETPPPELVF